MPQTGDPLPEDMTRGGKLAWEDEDEGPTTIQEAHYQYFLSIGSVCTAHYDPFPDLEGGDANGP